MNLNAFKDQTFIKAIQSLFSDLKVPVNYIADEPTTAIDILTGCQKNDVFFEQMQEVYFVGMVDDKAFKNPEAKRDEAELRAQDKDYDGILIFGVTLTAQNPTRSQLAEISRAFNREFKYTPVVIVFQYGDYIAFSSTERLTYKQEWREGEKAGKVSLLRDVSITNPHRGHLDILNELKIQTTGKKAVDSFDKLYKYWQEVFSVSLLNKKFYQELSNWYFWAIKHVTFPSQPTAVDAHLKDAKLEDLIQEHKAKNVIRLLTRLLFTWFIKEKGLIPDKLFDLDALESDILKKISPQRIGGLFPEANLESIYYKAILQNLFFATLNCPIENDGIDKRQRGFRGDESYGKHRGIDWMMRYKKYFKSPDAFLDMVNQVVPFLNGGLFECLDDKTQNLYIDGFSDQMTKGEQLVVPDYLFFGVNEEVDLSQEYGKKSKQYKQAAVKGLINILKSYKFTITENTPIEEDVALDPELLGKVFENLLASYNPETKTTARKQTGSFYTPREIVNYMVDESLIAYLKNTAHDWQLEDEALDKKLHQLTSFDPVNPFKENKTITQSIIKALDNCKILDPACGSGAFPMGILQKMVHILQKLDPENEHWKELQLNKALDETQVAYAIENKDEREQKILEIHNAFDERINDPDYARKLYLIENCIYGVDIQPVATQISKLRFFISLVVDQKPSKDAQENFNIRPLPNLETKFVTANTLIGIEKPNKQYSLYDTKEVRALERQLKTVRHKLFSARTKDTKLKYRQEDEKLRNAISEELKQNGWSNDTAEKLAVWDPYDQNASSSFFDPEWMFDIKDGFDVVIGNPPYVNFSKEGGVLGSNYENKNFYTYEKTGDIYTLFYEKGLSIIKYDGNLNYITSNKWMKANYGKKLRLLITKYNPKILIDLGADVFETATVDTNILMILKNNNSGKCFALDLTEISQIDSIYGKYDSGHFLFFSDGKPWAINDPDNFRLINKLFKNERLGDYEIKINRGLVTGDNKGLVLNELEYRDFYNTIEKENRIFLKKYILGENLRKYSFKSDKYLICIPKNTVLENDSMFLKKLKTRDKAFNNSISSRKEKGNFWYDLRGCSFYHRFEEEIIVWSDILSEPSFNIIKGIYVDTSAYFLYTKKLNLRYILGILNSRLIKYLIKQISPILGSKTIRWKKTFLEEIPFLVKKENIIIDLVNDIFDSKNNNKNTTFIEHQIDIRVYHIYGLSYEEALLIDNNLSKDDFEKYKV